MANSFVRYTGDGNTTQFSITFDYIETAHVACTVDGVSTTFTLSSGGTVATLSSAPALGASVEFRRTTSQTARLTDYQAGSVLKESDLDTDSQQAFFMGQEAIDNAADAIQVSSTNFQWDAQNKRITNVANPTNNQDVATKHYLENTWLSSSDKANINTLAGISNLSTLANNEANINTVATNNTNVTNVGSNITNVNTVANNIGSVNTVAADITKVVAVANDLAETVSEVQTVADDLNETTSEIDTVANNIANVNTVGNAIANVNNVGNNIANVNTVATNLTDINSFENSYKISASAPTGVAEGTLWFDTANDIMKVYDGSAFANAGSSVNGTSQRNKFTATANQTAFSGSDDNGVTLAYDPNFLDVYLNGVRLVNGSSNDYTATDGSTITLASGASAGDILNVVSFGTFQIASFSATALTSDTLAVARGGTGKTTSDLTSNQGKALVVNSAQNGFDLANTSSAEVYGFEMSYNPSTINISVTASGGVFVIDGVEQKTLELFEGNTYVFSYPSAHPFALSTTSNNSGNAEYTTGVTRDTSANTLTYVVPTSAPQLYYYCTNHSNMGGTANTPVPANNSLQVTTTNGGSDNISASTYANFDDVIYASTGFSWSLNNNGHLIATIA